MWLRSVPMPREHPPWRAAVGPRRHGRPAPHEHPSLRATLGPPQVKHTLALPFSNLPYLLDETDGASPVRLTQSQTILRYLARRYGAGTGLYEGPASATAAVDMVMDQTIDLRGPFTGWCYRDGSLAGFEAVLAGLAVFETELAKLGGTAFAAGTPHLTLADVALQEVLSGIQTAGSEVLPPPRHSFDAYPHVHAYLRRVEEHAEFKVRVLLAPDYMVRPFNNKVSGKRNYYGPGPVICLLPVCADPPSPSLAENPAQAAVWK